MDIGPTELLVILLIVVLLFGVGRIGQLGGELGKALREFRKGLAGEDETKKDAASSEDSTTKK